MNAEINRGEASVYLNFLRFLSISNEEIDEESSIRKKTKWNPTMQLKHRLKKEEKNIEEARRFLKKEKRDIRRKQMELIDTKSKWRTEFQEVQQSFREKMMIDEVNGLASATLVNPLSISPPKLNTILAAASYQPQVVNLQAQQQQSSFLSHNTSNTNTATSASQHQYPATTIDFSLLSAAMPGNDNFNQSTPQSTTMEGPRRSGSGAQLRLTEIENELTKLLGTLRHSRDEIGSKFGYSPARMG